MVTELLAFYADNGAMVWTPQQRRRMTAIGITCSLPLETVSSHLLRESAQAILVTLTCSLTTKADKRKIGSLRDSHTPLVFFKSHAHQLALSSSSFLVRNNHPKPKQKKGGIFLNH